jgi:hypothetical protein
VTRGLGRDKEYIEKNLKPSFKSRRVTIGAWGCFYRDELVDLYILPLGENINTKRYKQVLQRHLVLFYKRIRRKYSDKVVFIEDGAKWHKAKIYQNYLRNKGVKIINHLL